VGVGKMYYANGNFYHGDWDMNQKNGGGEQIYSNG